MISFTMRLAGIPVGVSCIYPSTKKFCADFLTDEEPSVSVCVREDAILAERVRVNESDPEPAFSYSDAYLETLALYRLAVDALRPYGVVLFHGAGIRAGTKGILFTAPSGTGKTTHIRLWEKKFASDPGYFTVINGDKPLLRVEEPGIRMYGTPWMGKERMGANDSVLLDAIVSLRRGSENRIREIRPEDAIPVLFRQTYRPDGREGLADTLALLNRISCSVRFYELDCNMEPKAADVAWLGIFECEDVE